MLQTVKVVHRARVWNNQLLGMGGQSSRLHDTKVKFGYLAEARL